MKKYTVGVVGATGMVGQRFVTLLENHPWFQLTVVAASARSAGKSYEEAVGPRWAMTTPIPEEAKSLVVLDALADRETIASSVDFIFCAVDMKKEEIRALEESYAKLECPVISNNSAHRWTPDVPMVIPEVNPEHLQVIQAQKSRLGTRRGFIAVKSNCSIQSYAPALHPLRRFGITQVLVCTYQAISGAGKTFTTWPEMVDNVIPYIGGEEEKSEQEPLKVWGTVEHGQIVPPPPLPSPPSAYGCLYRMAIPPLCLSPSVKSPRWRKLKLYGKTSRAVPKNWLSPAPPNSSFIILRKTTGPRPSWTGTLRAAWRSAWAVSVRIPSTTINLSACPTIPSAARPGGGVLLAELLCAEGYILPR